MIDIYQYAIYYNHHTLQNTIKPHIPEAWFNRKIPLIPHPILFAMTGNNYLFIKDFMRTGIDDSKLKALVETFNSVVGVYPIDPQIYKTIIACAPSLKNNLFHFLDACLPREEHLETKRVINEYMGYRNNLYVLFKGFHDPASKVPELINKDISRELHNITF